MTKTVSQIIAEELKKNKINDIFMLTGYGAMYLNDAIERAKIKYYGARNEAAAPMMAEAYAKYKNSIGAVCVTAGPGATNALPGLAEAYVDSAPIIVISGQVEKKFSSDTYKKTFFRTLGTAEFSITRVLKDLTKYCVTIKDPYKCLYEIQKCLYLCRSGRPGPVWIEVPLDVQSYKIKNVKKLKKFSPKLLRRQNYFHKIKILIKLLFSSKKPIFIIGNGVKQSNTKNEFIKLSKKLSIPFLTSRFANDLYSYDVKENMGLSGIKGTLFSKQILDEADLIISLGCRLAPTLVHGNPDNIRKNAQLISVNNDHNELNNPLYNFKISINSDLRTFFKNFNKLISKKKLIKNSLWLNRCVSIKNNNEIKNIQSKSNPIDLYRFMYDLCEYSKPQSILITDAGSNYYIGGQAWKFRKKQIEISSVANAAMGLSIPLSIGAAIASKKQVLSVTGDGSIELNIQELKTVSHYKLNIKTFVINNGGYVSMKKWQDNFFKGNRLDTEESTGVGTLNFKNIAKAFNLKYLLIKKVSDIKKKLLQIQKNNYPYLIEVVTDPNQKIYGKEF
jgi:acetolactate synthase-1/2/3 large subunit